MKHRPRKPPAESCPTRETPILDPSVFGQVPRDRREAAVRELIRLAR